MADNILKNEFMWEEKKAKKKLYKNWKLYASALGIIVIGSGTGLGIYYGINTNHSEITKIDLSTLELNKDPITGIENMTENDALNAFLENNNTITDLKDNVEVGTFTTPNYTSEGKLVVNAKENSKYNGNIEITINAIRKTDLSTLELNKDPITGIENMTENDALNAFLENNNTITDLKDNVEVGTFTTPNYTSEGKLVVNAKENSKYTGSIDITITMLTPPSDAEMAKEIAHTHYSITIQKGITLTEFYAKINPDFIQKSLPLKYKQYFNPILLKDIIVTDSNGTWISDANLSQEYPNSIYRLSGQYNNSYISGSIGYFSINFI